jgi:hypothetical protein
MIWKNFTIITLFLCALSPLSIEPARAQSQDREQEIQKLKDKLQQVDQMMGEVMAQIKALEQSGKPAGQQPAPTAPSTIVARDFNSTTLLHSPLPPFGFSPLERSPRTAEGEIARAVIVGGNQ